MTTFHHSPITADRIQRVITALKAAGPDGLTTLALNEATGSTRSSSDASETRACGVPIVCQYQGKSANGRRVYRYKLL
jgi:hypothetical protein